MSEQPKLVYMVGTKNHNGEDYAMLETKSQAESFIEELLLDGFKSEEIVCVKGVELRVESSVSIDYVLIDEWVLPS